MAKFKEFDHCDRCRNNSMVFMCKACDEFNNYVPRVSRVQDEVIRVLLDNPGAMLEDINQFNNVNVITAEGQPLHLDKYPIDRIRKDTLQGLLDRKIITFVGTRSGLTSPTTTYKLDTRIRWRPKKMKNKYKVVHTESGHTYKGGFSSLQEA